MEDRQQDGRKSNGACDPTELLDAALDSGADESAHSPDLETQGCGQSQGPFSQGPGPYQPAGGGGGRSVWQQVQTVIGVIAAVFIIVTCILNWANGAGAKDQRVDDRLGNLERDCKTALDGIAQINAKLESREPQTPGTVPRPRSRVNRQVRIPSAANVIKPGVPDYAGSGGDDYPRRPR